MSEPINARQSVELDPQTARVSSMLWKLFGAPKAAVTYFVIIVDGEERRATPAQIDEALAKFRGHTDEAASVYMARLAATVRAVFR